MKLLGIDYGKKQVGLAFSDGVYATGFGVVPSKEALLRIKRLVSELGIDEIVIGLPEGAFKKQVIDFGDQLKVLVASRVIYHDETLSSSQAHTVLTTTNKSRKRRRVQEHQVAAAVILQSYLDSVIQSG